ncbi:hypothetical protein P0E66_11325 [Enterococcus faecalis]|uniref:hypothetical protein n=1 Tax=Enterococcus faecalis TaxID=1351 RepID=UPI0025B1CDC2|nr:hypothetical protein [Enterococcus faecalis]MDN3201717.1 hypothetical protein [Enterococcus faecalis]
MGLSYVLVKPDELGKLYFGTHVESIGETRRRGRRSVTVATHEVYELITEKGSLTVKVPVNGALRGDFYQKEVRLINPKIVNRPVLYFNQISEREEARNRLFLEAERIALVGGKA